MTEEARGRLDTLREFLGLYYGLPVRTEAWTAMTNVRGRERDLGGRTVRQYLTDDILFNVLLPRVKLGTFALLGVTMEDLYPEDSWNYVFGQASLAHRVGVYSLVRFYPEFRGEERTQEADRLGLIRSLKLVVHETGHLFGVHHCQTYACVMNGTNSLGETDSRPMHLCPECLRKFRWNIGFDPVQRYEALRAFYEKHGLAAEAEWVRKRLREVGEPASADAPPETAGSAEPDRPESVP
jgi:archaemetzincin